MTFEEKMTKAPIPTKNITKTIGNTKTPPNTSITYGLGWTVEVKFVIQLVLLNRFTGTQPSYLPQQPCNQTDTHLNIKRDFLLRCMHHFKSALINNMDHMRISGIEPSSVILSCKL